MRRHGTVSARVCLDSGKSLNTVGLENGQGGAPAAEILWSRPICKVAGDYLAWPTVAACASGEVLVVFLRRPRGARLPVRQDAADQER